MEDGATARSRRWILAALLGATFMLLVDVTIVQVALPSIQQDLHASFSSLEWVMDAYALALAALILTSGALADRYGRKRIFVGGVVVFTVSSLLCGLAATPLWLALARALQGVGGAAMFATSLALIGQEFSGAARGTAIALWGSTVGGAVAVGPLIGGALTEALGWQWIFYVNVPIGVVVVAVALRHGANVRDPDARHADIGGLITFAGALSLLVLALLRGNEQGWSSVATLGAFAGSAALAGAFLVVERRQARPMFDLTLFRQRAFLGLSLGTFAIGAGMFGLLPYLTLYLQNVLGYSPFGGGLRVLPATALVFAVPLLTRGLVARVFPGVVLAVSLVLTGTGVLLMEPVSAGSRWTALLPGLLVAGVGIGLANPAIGQLALMLVPPQRSGMASGISNTCRIARLATGIAALGALLTDGIGSRLPRGGHALAAAVASAGTHAPGVARADATVAFVGGMHELLAAGGATVLLGAAAVVAFARRAERPVEEAPVLDVG